MKSSSNFFSYALRRFLEGIPLVLAIIVVNFIIIHAAPGDPITVLIGPFDVPQEYIDKMRAYHGLDKPLLTQLGLYILSILKGEFGHSVIFNQSVTDLILERAPATLLLMISQMVVFSFLGILLGVISSQKPYSFLDNTGSLISLIGYSIPVFWLGQLLILVFAIKLDWFPAQGMMSLRFELSGVSYYLDILHHLVMPAISLGASMSLCLVARLTRASMIEVLEMDYITVARAKGLAESKVVYKHALKNALLPVVTVIGMNFGFMLAGAVLTETVFGWPGLGRLMYEAINARDYPVLMGMFVVISISVIIVNILTDLVYALLDPRIKY
jgi:ABC-type dipeptide/oligopeptide/nickel transport system permease component